MKLADCQLDTATVTNIDLVCSKEDSKKVLDWIYNSGGSTRRTGPYVTGLQAQMGKFHVIGHIPGSWRREQIEKQLAAL